MYDARNMGLVKNVGRIVLLLSVVCFATEGIMRSLGYELQPTYNRVQIKSIYPNTCYKPDSILGYSLVGGEYLYEYKNGHSFKATHAEDGSRTFKHDFLTGKRISTYGGSLFYGQGLGDSLVFASILFNKLQGIQVRNFAIAGHSMVSSLQQLKTQVESGLKPDIAIVSYANYNLSRNVFSRKFRSNISVNQKLMGGNDMGYLYARSGTDEQLEFRIAPFNYRAFPFTETFVFASRLEQIFNELEHDYHKPETVDSLLLLTFRNYCDANEIKLVFANVGSHGFPTRVLKILKNQNIAHVDISVNYMDSTYNQLPYDNHPNALAHEIYANRIFDYLTQQNILTVSGSYN